MSAAPWQVIGTMMLLVGFGNIIYAFFVENTFGYFVVGFVMASVGYWFVKNSGEIAPF